MTENRWIWFEQPLNERIRSFLRLEFLFAKLGHHLGDGSEWGRRAAIEALLDVLSVLGRGELKGELIKDLGEHQSQLQRLSGRPGVDGERLRSVIDNLNRVIRALHKPAVAQPSALLRESEFLYAIHSRTAIPGGSCAFDLPAFHSWLNRDPDDVMRTIEDWCLRLSSFVEAVSLSLQLIREHGKVSEHCAGGGVFLYSPEHSCSMVRVSIPTELGVYPEISAGKHRVVIRFMRLGNVDARANQAVNDIAFHLQCCGSTAMIPA